ncbi:peptidoglycan DD-metalloendopeptidase family protein [Candidatus Saccharibacteria bacterium]|nr:peptidoglycan DD-metalloendopeptidase family protein [Candidatus Saccharibacteria bacterium]
MNHSINIGRYQLAVSLDRKRGRPKETSIGHAYDFLVYLVKVGTSKRFAGNPVSRVLRRVFEQSQARKMLGFNLATIALVVGMVIPPISAFNPDQPDQPNTIMATEDSLITEESVRVPVDSFNVSQGYNGLHRGIDLNEVEGAPVYPLMEGKAERVFYARFSYGNHILVNHGSGFKSLYAHLAKIVVEEGEEVDKNTVIGTVGHTGWATGSHLHLEVYDNGHTFNPLTILK